MQETPEPNATLDFENTCCTFCCTHKNCTENITCSCTLTLISPQFSYCACRHAISVQICWTTYHAPNSLMCHMQIFLLKTQTHVCFRYQRNTSPRQAILDFLDRRLLICMYKGNSSQVGTYNLFLLSKSKTTCVLY